MKTMSLPKKIKIIFLFFFFFSFFFIFKNSSRAAYEMGGAGGGFYDPTLEEHTKQLKEDQENKTISTASFTQTFVSNIFNSLSHSMVGEVCEEGDTECEQRLQSYGGGGVIRGTLGLISFLYLNPPASGVEYLADLKRNFGIVQPAYAQQGYGFQSLSPILKIWKALRNIAYLCFVIVFIITGLAIMFRVKISPQAVITLESALPKIVVALIVVTFSYAIAGFLIDSVYLLIGISFGILNSTGFLSGDLTAEKFFNLGIGDLLWQYFTKGFYYLDTLSVSYLVSIPVIRDIPIIGTGIGRGLLDLILTLALAFAFFKLFFSLLTCYIQIIISIVAGPLTIAMSALPGQEGKNFTGWIKGLLSNILVFVGVIFLFLFSNVIKNATENSTNVLWSPPGMFGTNSTMIGSLVAYGLLLLSPKIPEYIKALFEPKTKVTPPSQAIFAPIGGAYGAARSPLSYVGKVQRTAYEKKVVEDLQHLATTGIREKGLRGTIQAYGKAFNPFRSFRAEDEAKKRAEDEARRRAGRGDTE